MDAGKIYFFLLEELLLDFEDELFASGFDGIGIKPQRVSMT
jgi:hypothetical protein